MFGGEDEAQALLQAGGIARQTRWRRIVSNCAEIARLEQENTRIVRAADDAGDWRVAGCSSSAAWYAQASSSDYRTAAKVASTSEALRVLPALDEAMSTGALSLDQVAAAAQFATPETDAQIAQIAVGKAPGEIGRVARRIVPPKVADDAALYKRRTLSMTWTQGGRELAFAGRLPLEQGLVFEQAIRSIAKEQRASDTKEGGVVLDWQQYEADALVTLSRSTESTGRGVRRSQTTLIVHLSDDEPPILEGAGPIRGVRGFLCIA